MQRDDNLPLNEIYSTPEALHEEIEKILDLALYKVPENAPLRLRFISPVSFDKWLADDNYNEYRLTFPWEHIDGLPYITVSYCWKHTQSTRGLSPLPHYQISDGLKTGEPTPISCPNLVFHRAMLFARSRSCIYVWVDQECIDQTDPTDIQAHLKVMHRVYKESEWTVAPLSHPITDHRSLEQLITYLYHDYRLVGDAEIQKTGGDSLVSDGFVITFEERVQKATELLMSITQDAWFRRTWTFQEKKCSWALFLLIPIEVSPKISENVYLHMMGKDLCFDTAYFNGLSRSHELDMAKVAHVNSEVKWTMLDRTQFYDHFATSWDYDSFGGWGCYSIFSSIQDCDNQVVADRVAIFGQVCRFRNRLASHMLDSAEYSLSACVLALLLGNMDVTRDGRLELVGEIWEELQERSKVQTAAPNISAWMMVLLVNDLPQRKQRAWDDWNYAYLAACIGS